MPVFTSSIEVTADYPTIKPSLNLNFARSRALDPRITFTRASTATYVGRDGLIKTASENEPRFDHDPATGESLGLLLEETRTNYCGNSDMQANWGFGTAGDGWAASSGAQLSANPDGSSPAYHYSPSSTGGFHRFNRTVTVPTLDTNYVVSVFVKRVTEGSVSNLNRYVELEATGGWNGNSAGTGQSGGNPGSSVTFDMENLVIESETDNTAGYVGGAKIENYGNGWYRLSYVFNPGIGSNFTGTVWWGHPATLANDTGGETGNGNPSFYFWGASVEQGVFASSHIPTPANSSVTRSYDNAEITGDNFTDNFNTLEGTFVAECDRGNDGTEGAGIGAMRALTNSYFDMVQFGEFYDNAGATGRVYIGGTSQAQIGVTHTTGQGVYNRYAFAYKKDSFAGAVNGVGQGEDTSGNVPTILAKFLFGGYNDDRSTQNLDGHIKYLHYYPQRLTNAQLQLITT